MSAWNLGRASRDRFSGKFAHRFASEHLSAGKRERKQNQERIHTLAVRRARSGGWWALQTVTTVGYGDVTPARTSGRIVAAFVMLQGIAFLAILVAAITSTFVAREGASKRKLGKKRAAKNGSTLASMISLLVWIGWRG